jgi:hypothetical protein
VVYHEGGTVYFDPALDRYLDSPLQPVEARLAQGADLLDAVIDGARRFELDVGAWVVALHNTRLGTDHPGCVQETAGGDRLVHALCPANPDVRAYVMALIEDVASRGFDHLLLESLSYMPFDHGYHHERALLGLDARTRFLLGLCFCRHCLEVGATAGTDVARLRDWVRDQLRLVLARGDALSDLPANQDWASGACEGDLGRYLAARTDTVTRLAKAVAEVGGAAGVPDVCFIDHAGAVLGYATGYPETAERAVDVGWRDGISVGQIGAVMGVATTAYFADPDRLATEVHGYIEELSPDSKPHVILRPMPPDTRSGHELTPKLELLSAMGVDVVSFYHYGLMRLESIDWTKRALAAIDSE